MAEPSFFPAPEPLSITEIIALTGARLVEATDPERAIKGVAALGAAGPGDISFVEGPAYVAELRATRAGVCFCPPALTAEVPPTAIALETSAPGRAFAQVMARLFPQALRGTPLWSDQLVSPTALVHASARLEDGVVIEPFALVGEGAAVGRGSRIGAGAVIGPSVQIGRGCGIGAGTTIVHALVGDEVLIHPGARIGQDGFGFIAGRGGHMKVPQIGRVIIQDKVEIGANTTIDRGSVRDTIIGEGTKIDNLCQVAHNVVIGRHCLIAAHVAFAGSVTVGDLVAIGGNSSIAGHLTIGNGANLAGMSGVMHDVPAGEKWIGSPARPIKEWLRGQAMQRRMRGQGHREPSRGGEG